MEKPFDVTALAQGITECAQHCGRRSRHAKKTDADLFILLDLLRPRRERPRGRRAAEKRYERAPIHSITSSARASSVGGNFKFGSARTAVSGSQKACEEHLRAPANINLFRPLKENGAVPAAWLQ
jgi:hypothetical protein